MITATEFVDMCREYGRKRLEIPAAAKSLADWQAMWYDPIHPYTFEWGDCWKGNIEYSVDDYEAEVGFWLDFMGLDSNAMGPDFTMVMTPDNQFTFSIKIPGKDGVTPPKAIRIQFMLKGIRNSASDLERRGIVFEKPVAPESPGSSLYVGTLRTPHGIAVDLWGVEEPHHSPE